jgi:hypothetical protein
MDSTIELRDSAELLRLAEQADILRRLRKAVSGTYKNSTPATDKTIIELRVDVDGRRPQQRISGDIFKQRGLKVFNDFILSPGQQLESFDKLQQFQRLPFYYTSYEYSFVVEAVTITEENGVAILTGPIIYYKDPGRIDETIEVRIRRVSYFSKAADASVTISKSGTLIQAYCLPRISEYFRTVTLEIDRYQGTSFPPGINPCIDPRPADLPCGNISTSTIFQRAGLDMTVIEDDVLNDSDSPDPGNNWSEAELHDLMEDRYDRFANTLQWNTYGVVVPRFGDPNYNSGYYGTMFDWGGWQAGDTYFRQGCAIAEDAIQGRAMGTLYNTNDKQERLTLQTFCHEVGHSFNLPHSWSRNTSADAASESFMNYPWGYTGGGESGFWSNFRWEFDDVELIWMRHQDRNDVIFGGTDWIGNNLSVYLEPQIEISNAPLRLELSAPPVLDFAEPVRLEVKLTNVSDTAQLVIDRLELEDHFITLYIRRPNGEFVRYIPPVRRLKAPGDLVELAPTESIQDSILVSFGARGYQFQEPGEYWVRAYYGRSEDAVIVSKAVRFRVAAPSTRQDEELAYLLFDRNAAKFLYFNGTERYPEVTSRLEEAVVKYEKTNPRVVRHIRAALGVHASRTFKRVGTTTKKKPERVVIARKPKLSEAITHLQRAIAVLPNTKALAVGDTRYAHLVGRLVDSQIAYGKKADAERTLRDSAQYLKQRKAGKQILDDFEERAKMLKKKTRKR